MLPGVSLYTDTAVPCSWPVLSCNDGHGCPALQVTAVLRCRSILTVVAGHGCPATQDTAVLLRRSILTVAAGQGCPASPDFIGKSVDFDPPSPLRTNLPCGPRTGCPRRRFELELPQEGSESSHNSCWGLAMPRMYQLVSSKPPRQNVRVHT